MKRKIYTNKLTDIKTNSKGYARGMVLNVVIALVSLFSINFSSAQTGEALHFDGINDKVDLPFIISGSYTKEAWIYADPSALTGFPNILTGTQTSLQLANGVLTAGHNPGYNQAIDQTGPISANTWYHVAVTYDSTTGIINLYKNGVLVSVPGSTAPLYTETTMKIGTFNNSFYFNGKIDEVRFWSVPRTAVEINASMNCGLTGDEPFLDAYYNFNQGVAGADNTGLITLPDLQEKCIPYDGNLVGFTLNGPTSNWVAPGATILTNCATSYENISVVGNSILPVCITLGDNTPSLVDSTDFGDYVASPVIRTFIVQNTGSASLTITDATITGTDAADFTILSSPTGVIAPGGTASLTIQFSPATGGLTARSALVTISNSDADEAAFTFNIAAFNRGIGQALSFDGIDDSVSIPVRLTGSYTKEVWINTAQLGGFPNLISGSGTALFLNNGHLAAGHAPTFNQVLDPLILVANTWYHVAVSYDSVTGNMNLYRDGALVSTGIVAPTTYTEDSLKLGTFAQANFYAGTMDEVRLWDTARTAAQILNSMNCGLTGDEFYLLAYYKFNQGAAGGNNPEQTTLADSADHCIPRTGILHNFALNGATSNFVQPGAPVSGTCAGTYQNISIGAGTCIESGDSTVSTSEGTDFGLNLINNATTQTFTITNTGTATLDLTGATPVTITGPDAGVFTATQPLATTLAPGASTTFTVTFVSPTQGIFNATVLVTNNDPDETPYSFNIQAGASATTPVSLLSFEGVLRGTVVKLNWKTASEINNRGFDVLRSAGNQVWEKVAFVAGSRSASGSQYELTDYAPLKGINTYKLRQIDLDGSEHYSDIVVVNNNGKSTVITSFPNPFQQSFSVAFNDQSLLNTNAKVTSATGVTVAVFTLRNYRQDINLSKVPAGLYFISFVNGDVIRVIKQ